MQLFERTLEKKGFGPINISDGKSSLEEYRCVSKGTQPSQFNASCFSWAFCCSAVGGGLSSVAAGLRTGSRTCTTSRH